MFRKSKMKSTKFFKSEIYWRMKGKRNWLWTTATTNKQTNKQRGEHENGGTWEVGESRQSVLICVPHNWRFQMEIRQSSTLSSYLCNYARHFITSKTRLILIVQVICLSQKELKLNMAAFFFIPFSLCSFSIFLVLLHSPRPVYPSQVFFYIFFLLIFKIVAKPNELDFSLRCCEYTFRSNSAEIWGKTFMRHKMLWKFYEYFFLNFFGTSLTYKMTTRYYLQIQIVYTCRIISDVFTKRTLTLKVSIYGRRYNSFIQILRLWYICKFFKSERWSVSPRPKFLKNFFSVYSYIILVYNEHSTLD